MNIIIKLLGSIKRLGIIMFIEKKYNSFLSKIYVASISNRLKGTKRFSISFGHKVFISGPECITLGEGVIIGWGSRVECVRRWAGDEYNPDLVLGSYSVINPLCHIGCLNKISIGEYTTIGERTYITDHVHGKSDYENMLLPPRKRKLFSKGAVSIGSYVSIGENCAIMPGVTIGDHAIIGANAVVTKDIPPFAIAGGNPAKVLKIVEPE